MKNPILFIFGVVAVLILPGCFHQSDEEVLGNAHGTYDVVATRYVEMLNAPDDESILEFAYKFGAETALTPWIFSWNNVVGITYLPEGTPLHKTAYFIQGDCNEISKHLGLLEGRMLSSTALYGKLKNISSNLYYGLQVIKTAKAYAEESRFIESHRLQTQQINEARRQNYLIEESNRKPVIVHQEKTVIKCDARRNEPVRAPKIEKVIVEERCCSAKPAEKVVIKEQCDAKPKKKKKKKEHKDETIINVDDIPGKKAHLII